MSYDEARDRYTKENSLETRIKEGFKGILVDLVANQDLVLFK